jgi:hypothetical protein
MLDSAEPVLGWLLQARAGLVERQGPGLREPLPQPVRLARHPVVRV